MAQKFMLVCLSFFVPVAYLLINVASDRHAAMEFAERERVGLDHFLAIEHVLSDAAFLRGRSILITAGVLDPKEYGPAEQRLADSLSALEKKLASEVDPLGLSASVAQAKQAMAALRQAPPPSLEHLEQVIEHGNQAVAGAIALFDALAARSNLALDPDADSYYLMTIGLDAGPRLREALGRVRSVGATIAGIADVEKMNPELMMTLHNADALSENYLERIGAALRQVEEANARALKGVPVNVVAAVREKFILRIDDNFPFKGPIGVKPQEWLDLGSEQVKAVEGLLGASALALRGLIDQRVDRLRRDYWTALGVTAVFLSIGLYLLAGYYVAANRTYAELGQRLAALGRGDLTDAKPMEGRDELVVAANTLRDAIGRLRGLIKDVRDGSTEMSDAVSQIATSNVELSERSTQMAAVVEQTSASTSTLADAVGENLQGTREANELVHDAARIAGTGGAIVEQAVRSMEGISASSRRIGDITQVIDGIAFQTNILALNAAVEAARAGEQGRGFAVVAGEVRTLAQRSAAAAREIKTLIESSVETVSEGEQHVVRAGETMSTMVTAIEKVKAIIENIAGQSKVQADQVRQLAAAVREVDETTQRNAAMVEETAAAATQLRMRAGQLAESAELFRT
ncbi:methyl-accepting chemotaxis protein [Ideonella sp. DXS29W]|uniref:Methyl-accepting chemotaxis protein n=1 Tax=Ideonella lacteola TaxID=2984193 RepID=A0ABU9BZC0_9BURK